MTFRIKTAKKIIPLALAACLLAMGAAAQFLGADETLKPALSQTDMVAKVWYRLAGKRPDFEGWARLTKAYANADTFRKEAVMAEEAKKASEGFDLLVPGEVLILDYPVVLSEYSLKAKGYLIENFTPTTFIAINHAGENFAVVPQGLYEMQWVPVDTAAAMALDILRLSSRDGKTATLTFQLSPIYALPDNITADSVSYKVLAAEVVTMSFYDKDGKLIWRSQRKNGEVTNKGSTQRNELLNLYQ